MEQDAFGAPLTPALYDFYVARARAERAKAIAAFVGQLAGWLKGAARRLVPRHRVRRVRPVAGSLSAH